MKLNYPKRDPFKRSAAAEQLTVELKGRLRHEPIPAPRSPGAAPRRWWMRGLGAGLLAVVLVLALGIGLRGETTPAGDEEPLIARASLGSGSAELPTIPAQVARNQTDAVKQAESVAPVQAVGQEGVRDSVGQPLMPASAEVDLTPSRTPPRTLVLAVPNESTRGEAAELENVARKKSRAQYLVLEGFERNELSDVPAGELHRLADTALALAPDEAGGYGLRGAALVREARTKKDVADRVKDLRRADAAVIKGLELRDELRGENKRKIAALLVQTRAVLLLELAHYLTDPAQQEKTLNEAKKYAEESLELDARNIDAWTTSGFILESIGWLLHKPDQFEKASERFDKAITLAKREAGQTTPWLGPGRTRFRWADTLYALRGWLTPECRELLDLAQSDLVEVFESSRSHVEAAEACYWQARILKLRDRPSEAQAQFLKKARDEAQRGKAEDWEETILDAWASLSYHETLDLYKNRVEADLNEALMEAKDRCEELERLSPVRAALTQINLVRIELYRGRAKPSDVLEVFERGLKPARTQDQPYQVVLLAQRADYYLKLSQPEMQKAYDDATEALKRAEKTSIHPATQALALASAGLARYAQAKTNEDRKEEYRDESIKHLREALALAPNHYAAYAWKAYLAALLSSTLNEEIKNAPALIKQEGKLAAEACRWYLEADSDMPAKEREGYGWLKAVRANLKEKAVPKLEKAIEQFPTDADVRTWKQRVDGIKAVE